MDFRLVIFKLLEWILYQLLTNPIYKAARKMRNYGFILKNTAFLKSSSPSSSSLLHQSQTLMFPIITKCDVENRGLDTLVCDVDNGVLLKTQSFFPYFMLVAFEGGSVFRAIFLLCSYPFLWVLSYEGKLKVMIFITFCGLKMKKMESVSRAVLPKFYLENINAQAYDVWVSTGSRFVFTSVPRVMVEGFLKDYLSVDGVFGTELKSFGLYFTGFVSESGLDAKQRGFKEIFEVKKPDIGIGSSSSVHHLPFLSICKEAYVINNEDIKNNPTSFTLPRSRYPKPLIFHDGRLAFLPTPLATLQMFLWLPLGIPLSIIRLSVGILLPYKVALFLGGLTGISINLKHPTTSQRTPPPPPPPPPSSSLLSSTKHANNRKGVLYVCTHRTLLDPVFLSTSLQKPLTAVTYSLSKFSEVIAPIKTVRLTRDRAKDGATMEKLLSEGDLVVCPEGTTCREPYLLRFSSLFAELADEIVPVAMNTHVSMFYGTTASGMKCLDPIFFMMNPKPSYSIEVLEKLPEDMSCKNGKKSSFEVANYIQKQLGDALGFECTSLTRKDKYLMLAGNDGSVKD